MPNYKCESFRQDTLDATGHCKLVFCGMLRNEKQWQERWHKHDNACELILVLHGEGIVCFGNETVPFKAGDLIVHNAGVVHTKKLLSHTESVHIFYAVLSRVSIRGLPENELVPQGMSPVLPTHDSYISFKNIFEMIYKECQNQDIGYERIVQGLAQALLTLATRLANDQYQLMLNGSAHSLEKQIREYIETNCTSDLSLKDIASHFFISHYYLEHLFKQTNGISPISYLIRYRMNKACSLLESTNISIKTIASTIGYNNPAYFSLAFKKINGVSPAEYRKQYQKSQ